MLPILIVLLCCIKYSLRLRIKLQNLQPIRRLHIQPLLHIMHIRILSIWLQLWPLFFSSIQLCIEKAKNLLYYMNVKIAAIATPVTNV